MNNILAIRYFKRPTAKILFLKEHSLIMESLLNIMLKIHTKALFLKKTLIEFKRCLKQEKKV